MLPIETADSDTDENQSARFLVAGERVDMRTREGRRFRAILTDLTDQMGRDPSISERMQLVTAATLALLCERDSLKMLRGEAINETHYRANVMAQRSALIGLGLSKASRHMAKRDLRNGPSMLSHVIESDAEEV